MRAGVRRRAEKNREKTKEKKRKTPRKNFQNKQRRRERFPEYGTRCGRGVRPPHCPPTGPDQNALRRKDESMSVRE